MTNFEGYKFWWPLLTRGGTKGRTGRTRTRAQLTAMVWRGNICRIVGIWTKQKIIIPRNRWFWISRCTSFIVIISTAYAIITIMWLGWWWIIFVLKWWCSKISIWAAWTNSDNCRISRFFCRTWFSFGWTCIDDNFSFWWGFGDWGSGGHRCPHFGWSNGCTDTFVWSRIFRRRSLHLTVLGFFLKNMLDFCFHRLWWRVGLSFGLLTKVAIELICVWILWASSDETFRNVLNEARPWSRMVIAKGVTHLKYRYYLTGQRIDLNFG